MGYVNMNHADWMQNHLDILRRNGKNKKLPERLTAFQRRVTDILGIVGGGIYNAPLNPDKIDWQYGGIGIAVIWRRELSTFDFNALTMLVFLCHESRIRCQIEAVNHRNLRLSFFQRQPKGGMAIRHPNLQEAVAEFDQYVPQSHYLRREEHKVEAE